MTDKEILEKAIQKAIDGGWHFPYSADFLPLRIAESYPSFALNNGMEYEDYDDIAIECIVFNHDFAKALWGEMQSGHAFEDAKGSGMVWIPEWKYHIQQMVVSKDPIKYLGENI